MLNDILGQRRAIETLQSALRSGKVHHAFIFHGPQGVGKYTTAVALAGVLLCHDPQTDLAGQVERCGTCESCKLMAHGDPAQTHPDLHVVRKELAAESANAELRRKKQTNIPIDLLRELIVGGTAGDGKFHEAHAYRTPNLRHQKVFIIDEAELLDKTGQNALLKTLEEPPPGTFLILVTSAEDKLLPTIRSRCQRVGFIPLDDETIRQWMTQQNATLDQRESGWLTTFADGSLGRAALALQYGLHNWAATVLPTLDVLARGQPAPQLGSQLAQMIDDFAAQWVKDYPSASKEASNRRAAALAWSLIARHARTRLREAAQTHTPSPDDDATRESLSRWTRVIESLEIAERELDANLNVALVCDHAASLVQRSLTGDPVYTD